MDPIDEALANTDPTNKYGKGVKGCVDLVAQKHPDRVDAVLRAIAASYELGSRVVARILEDEGIQLSDQAIARHRRGACTCQTR